MSNTLADEDGLGIISYAWLANGLSVGTGNSYTVTANEVGKALTVAATYTDLLDNAESVSSQATAAVTAKTVSADSIFIAQGGGIKDVGVIRVMADFSKAAYHLEPSENNVINDLSPNADSAVADLTEQGWTPLNLSPVLRHTSTVAGQTITNGMFNDGFYVNGNAAACVARCGDAVVISFRGTNDNGDSSLMNDPGNMTHPDVDQWTKMYGHYALFKPLITAFDKYILDSSHGINKVYVTGHSLGGAMAIQYMGTHSGSQYSAITFAAPGFSTEKYNDSRVTHIEINGDLTPDLGLHGGRTIHFDGNADAWYSTDANHSMDYYRQITKSVDEDSWTKILAETGDQTVLLSGKADGNDFIVDGQLSGNNGLLGGINSYFDEGNDILKDSTFSDYQVYYGGKGNDILTGGRTNELMLGGVGDDTLIGKGGADRLCGGTGKDVLTGGGGNDRFLFTGVLDSAVNTLRDVISDFVKGDKIDLSAIDANTSTTANNAFVTLSMGDLANVIFNKTNALYFDTIDHILFGNNDSDTTADFSILLTGVTTLSTADFVL